jgi:hypothetical protein
MGSKRDTLPCVKLRQGAIDRSLLTRKDFDQVKIGNGAFAIE